MMPSQHRDRRDQYRRVEQFLADTLQRAGDGFGQTRDDQRPGDAGGDASADPAASAGDAARRCQTIETIRAASSVSRKTMTAVANMFRSPSID